MNCRAMFPYIMAGVGVVLIGLGAGLGWGAFPNIIKDQVEKNIDFTDPDSEGYKNFITPPVDVYIRFTFLEVTNKREFSLGDEKAKFEEKGPYAYREVREKINLTINEESNYLDYAQHRYFEFSPSESCEGCTKDDEVSILNMPLLGGVLTVIDSPTTLNGVLGAMAAALDDVEKGSLDLFLKDTVDNIIFAGVNNKVTDVLITDRALKNKLPPAVGANGFAIFNTKNDTTHNECYRVAIDVDNHSNIMLWGKDLDNLAENITLARTCYTELEGNHPLVCTKMKPWWPYPDLSGLDYHDAQEYTTTCNLLSGTNGEQFPPFLEEDEDLDIFTTDLCRSMRLKYLEKTDIDGIKVHRYEVPREDGFVNKTKNVCFCEELSDKVGDEEPCYKVIPDSDELDISACNIETCHDGLQNLEKCMLSPVIMSSPHFYMAEQQLAHFAEDSGLAPVYEKHRTFLDVEPLTGSTLSVHKRIQINQPLKPTHNDRIPFLKEIADIPAFPILWLDEGADIDQENIDKVKSMVTTPLIALDATKYGMIGVGAGAILVAAAAFLFCKPSPKV